MGAEFSKTQLTSSEIKELDETWTTKYEMLAALGPAGCAISYYLVFHKSIIDAAFVGGVGYLSTYPAYSAHIDSGYLATEARNESIKMGVSMSSMLMLSLFAIDTISIGVRRGYSDSSLLSLRDKLEEEISNKEKLIAAELTPLKNENCEYALRMDNIVYYGDSESGTITGDLTIDNNTTSKENNDKFNELVSSILEKNGIRGSLLHEPLEIGWYRQIFQIAWKIWARHDPNSVPKVPSAPVYQPPRQIEIRQYPMEMQDRARVNAQVVHAMPIALGTVSTLVSGRVAGRRLAAPIISASMLLSIASGVLRNRDLNLPLAHGLTEHGAYGACVGSLAVIGIHFLKKLITGARGESKGKGVTRGQ